MYCEKKTVEQGRERENNTRKLMTAFTSECQLCFYLVNFGVLHEQSLAPSPRAYIATAMLPLDWQTMRPTHNRQLLTTVLYTFLALAHPKTPASLHQSNSNAVLKL
jgi:hypothetical protein